MASGLVSIVFFAMIQVTQQMSRSQKFFESKSDVLDLRSTVKMILNDERFCRVSLAGEGPLGAPSSPVVFKKSKIDEDKEGLNVSLYLSDTAGVKRTEKKLNGADNPENADFSRFGKLIIKSVKLIMNNGKGSNYPDSPNHKDVGVLRVAFERSGFNGLKLSDRIDFPINVMMSTGQDPEKKGETRILNCSLLLDGGAPTSGGNALDGVSVRSYTMGWGRFLPTEEWTKFTFVAKNVDVVYDTGGYFEVENSRFKVTSPDITHVNIKATINIRERVCCVGTAVNWQFNSCISHTSEGIPVMGAVDPESPGGKRFCIYPYDWQKIGLRGAFIRKSGKSVPVRKIVSTILPKYFNDNDSAKTVISLETTVPVKDGDYFEIFGWQNSGKPLWFYPLKGGVTVTMTPLYLP